MLVENPIAIKFNVAGPIAASSISIDPALAGQLTRSTEASAPAILIVRDVTVLNDLAVGIVNSADILAAYPGRWDSALLIVLPDAGGGSPAREEAARTDGD